jgi:hypothetical protein
VDSSPPLRRCASARPPARNRTVTTSLPFVPAAVRTVALRRLFGGFPVTSTGEITIRRATDADRAALERLAQIDQLPLPRGATLVAEVDRRVVAGIALDTAEPIADPFRARRDVVQLLQVRAAQLAA